MKFWKKIAIAGAGLLSLITVNSALYVVDQTQQAVVTRFGQPKRVIVNPINQDEKTEQMRQEYKKEGIAVSEGPGLYIKAPFIDSVKRFDRRLLRWDGFPEEVPTKDKKFIFVDSTIRFNIYDPLKFLKTVGTEENAYARLDDIVDAATRNSITTRDLIEIVRTSNRKMQVSEQELATTVDVGNVSEGRAKIAQEVGTKSKEGCQPYGIEIHPNGYMIKGIIYVQTVQDKVKERMISERMRIAAKYVSEGESEYQTKMGDKEKELKRITSEAYKTAETIKGEAEAKALKIYADAYNKDHDFYNFMRTLDLYKKTLSTKTKIMIGTDNPLFRLIKGEELKPKQ